MNKLAFSAERTDTRQTLQVGFAVAGDPLSPTLEELSSADVIELGIPFSDPVAEAPDIQEANLRALAENSPGGAVGAALRLAREAAGTGKPVVLYSYYNPVLRYGVDAFFKACAEAGARGVVLADLPFEENLEVLEFAKRYGVELISTIATEDAQRARLIAEEACGYLRVMRGAAREGLSAVLEAVGTELPVALL